MHREILIVSALACVLALFAPGCTDDGKSNETASETTDQTDGNDDDVCEMFCAAYDACDPSPGCAEDCTELLAEVAELAECHDGYVALFACLGGLDCPGIDAFEAGTPGAACAAELAATEAACEELICEFEAYGGKGTCGAAQTCSDGVRYSIGCVQATGVCTCYADDVEFASCLDYYEAACGVDGDLTDALTDCCGV
jgi:hypothetical protein